LIAMDFGTELESRKACFQIGAAFRRNACFNQFERDGSVERAGIHMHKTKALAEASGGRGFSGCGAAIDGDDDETVVGHN